MLADWSPEEYSAELARLKAVVINILHFLKEENHLQMAPKDYPFSVMPGRNREGTQTLLIVIGSWVSHQGLERELRFELPDYERIVILYFEKDFAIDDRKELKDFLLSHNDFLLSEGIRIVLDPTP